MIIVAYNRTRAEALLLEWTPQLLLEQAEAGVFSENLGDERAAEVRAIALDWVRRALGPLSLRDALLVDEQRGARLWPLLCAWLVVERCELPVPLPFSVTTLSPLNPALLPLDAPWATGLRKAAAAGMELVVLPDEQIFPAPPCLEELLPLPTPRAQPEFEPPSGVRQTFATALALAGVALLGVPLLLGEVPVRPAGVPLALITLALLVGIRAGMTGYAGSLCIWLVANLPGFHHGSLLQLWPALPLLAVGLLLLLLDTQVRAMWRWIRSVAPVMSGK